MTRRDRLAYLGDLLVEKALLLRRAGRQYPAHWKARYQALHKAWCETYGRAGW
jgi:hypothetical protein